MIPVTRRGFLQAAGAAALATALMAVPADGAGRARRGLRKVRVRPLHPNRCSASHKAFCQKAKFYTAADAIRVVARRNFECEIYRINS